MSKTHTQFQLERMALFSDAVFAIAITLLVIEIKVPDITIYDNEGLWEAMRERWYEFFGVALSFAVIGQFWTVHHRMFGHITGYNNAVLWLNLHVLFWIILMPFSSGLNSKYGNLNSAWSVYCFDIFMIGLSMYFLWKYAFNPKRGFSDISGNPVLRKRVLSRSLVMALIFLSGLLLAQFESSFATIACRAVFFLAFPAIAIINRRYPVKH
jgi:uncharacterized membrane protein